MKKVYTILALVLVLLIGAGVVLLVFALRSNDDMVRKVELGNETETVEELEFTAENFLPGDVREYTVILHGKQGGELELTFECEALTEGKLWKYLDLEIAYGETKRKVAMSDLFEGSSLKFDFSIEDEGKAEFTVRYIMPETVGNEAQNETADFILRLTAQRK